MKLSEQDFEVIFDALSFYANDVTENGFLTTRERKRLLKRLDEAKNALGALGTY